MDYLDKYIKYKSKYTKLKKTIDNDYNFYFVHMTKNLKNFKNILKSGQIKLGSNIPIKDKFLSGFVNEPYVFTNIYFEDLDNLDDFKDLSLIIKPKIINSQSIEFVGGWGNFSIAKINPNDSESVKIEKINQMKKFIEKPYNLPNILLECPRFMQHEVRFTKPIDINKYLEGVVIYYTNNDELEKKLKKVKKLLKKYNLDNINIFSHDKKIIYSS